MEILYAVLGIIALIIIAGVLYFVCSPMPVVRLLRRKMDGEITMPENCRDAVENVEIHRDLTYKSAYAQNNFDLFLPKAQGRHPLGLWGHGRWHILLRLFRLQRRLMQYQTANIQSRLI